MSNTNPTPSAFLEKVLSLCKTHLVTDSRVLGLCVFGSLSIEQADEFSDIDLGILVEEDQIEVMLSDREIIEGVAPLLACSPTTVDDDCIFALHDVDGRLVKIDYNYFSDRRIPPWLSIDTRVVFDPSVKLAQLVAIPPEKEQLGSFSSDYFCIQLWSAVRMLRRGELFEACDILNHLRDPVLTRLLGRVYNIPLQNYRRVEQLYPTEIVERLRHTFARPEPDDLNEALAHLAALYLHAIALTKEHIGAKERHTIDRILQFASVPGASHGVML